jgi:hypothetical protein
MPQQINPLVGQHWALRPVPQQGSLAEHADPQGVRPPPPPLFWLF